MRKFWVRHFEKFSVGASLMSAVTAIALIIAMAVAGDTRTGWFETAIRYIWPVFALGALVISIGAAQDAFGLSKGRPPASDHSIPEFMPWWSVGAIAVFPVLLVVFAFGGWGMIVFAEGGPAPTGGPGVERGSELERFVPMLVIGSVLVARFASVFRVTRRDADGDRVLKAPVGG